MKQSAKTFIQWREGRGDFRGLDKVTFREAKQFLQERANSVGQKTLDADRHFLQKFLGGEIAPVKAAHKHNELATQNRAYTVAQVEKIVERMSERNALATKIAFSCGLRAHELFTIKNDGHGNYTVTGKGGLERRINMPSALANELEKHRNNGTQTVRDRGVVYHTQYNIAGGQSLSNAFSKASHEALDISRGFHGLRHGYAQRRMHELQSSGYDRDSANGIVSRELGHFRKDITERYLK
jgi:integrase